MKKVVGIALVLFIILVINIIAIGFLHKPDLGISTNQTDNSKQLALIIDQNKTIKVTNGSSATSPSTSTDTSTSQTQQVPATPPAPKPVPMPRPITRAS